MKTRGRGQPTAGAPTIAEEGRQQGRRRGCGLRAAVAAVLGAVAVVAAAVAAGVGACEAEIQQGYGRGRVSFGRGRACREICEPTSAFYLYYFINLFLIFSIRFYDGGLNSYLGFDY